MMEEESRPEEKAYMRKLYKVSKTVASMMRQRKLIDPDPKIFEAGSYEDFLQRYRMDNQFLQKLVFFKKDNSLVRLAVIIESEQSKSLTLERVKQIFNRVQQDQINNAIIIINGDIHLATGMEKKARDFIEEINQLQAFGCEVFSMDDLVFDITKHELVPEHILLTETEKKVQNALLVKYRVTDSQLPRILLSDPVAKFLGLKHGEVVKIVRTSETAGKYVTYRIAI